MPALKWQSDEGDILHGKKRILWTTGARTSADALSHTRAYDTYG